MKFVFLFLFGFCHLLAQGQDASRPITTTKLGQIRGTQTTSTSGRNFLAFRGIPYAKPPVGELRFQDPEPVEKWDGVLDATKEASACVQYDVFFRSIRGQEDCLLLNVYTHQLQPNDLRPVMVWIHGGAWFLGSGNGQTDFYGPNYLLNRDIVLVTINYRLGPFGFLSTEDEVAPGNYGLLDQSLALKWVQDHIDRFGGDPKSVTIFGESAGGASVHYQVLSPRSQGLFHRAIAQSGSATCPWSISDTVGKYTEKLALHFKCPTTPSSKLVQCLRGKKADEIANFRKKIQEASIFPIGFGPRVDRERKSPFISRHPIELMKNGQFNNVPMIIGMTKDEGTFITGEFLSNQAKQLKSIQKDPLRYFRIFLGLEYHPDGEELTKKFVQHYLQLEKPLKEQISEMGLLFSDHTMFKGIDDTARLTVQHNTQPTYLYWYAHQGQHSIPRLYGAPGDVDFGVSHADELFMIFNNMLVSSLSSPEDIKVSNTLIDLWTSFASQGKPVSDGTPSWLPSTKDQPRYLTINTNPALVNGSYPFKQRIDDWQNIWKASGSKDEL